MAKHDAGGKKSIAQQTFFLLLAIATIFNISCTKHAMPSKNRPSADLQTEADESIKKINHSTLQSYSTIPSPLSINDFLSNSEKIVKQKSSNKNTIVPKDFHVILKTALQNRIRVHSLANGKTLVSIVYYIDYENLFATAHPHVYLVDEISLADISERFEGLKKMGSINFSKQKDKIFSKYVPETRCSTSVIGNRRIVDIVGLDEDNLYVQINRDGDPIPSLKASELWSYSNRRWKRFKKTKIVGRSYVSLQSTSNGVVGLELPEPEATITKSDRNIKKTKPATFIRHNVDFHLPKLVSSGDEICNESIVNMRLFDSNEPIAIVTIENINVEGIQIKRWDINKSLLNSQTIKEDVIVRSDIESDDTLSIQTREGLMVYHFKNETWTKVESIPLNKQAPNLFTIKQAFVEAGLGEENATSFDYKSYIEVWKSADDIFYISAVCPEGSPEMRCLYRNIEFPDVVVDRTPEPTVPKNVEDNEWYPRDPNSGQRIQVFE